MSDMDLATIAVAGALVVTSLTVALTASWRSLRRAWSRITWTPRLTPGTHHVVLVMGEQGHIGVLFDKIPPEVDAAQLFAAYTERWFAVGASMGIRLDYSNKIGGVIETPDGPEYVVALCRPATPTVRARTEADAAAIAEVSEDDGTRA